MKYFVLCIISSFFIMPGSLSTGCGYHPLPNQHQTIAIPIFENKTIYHGYEFELTRLVHQRISGQVGLLLTEQKGKGDFLLSGEIIDCTKPALVEAGNDQVIVSQVTITLKIMLKDQKNGKIIYEGSTTETAGLISSRGQNETSARAEVFKKLAAWVVAQLTNHMIIKDTQQ